MQWTMFTVVVIWLSIVSCFDLQKKEIPHSAWVIIPLLNSCLYRGWAGGWALVALTGLVVLVSERERIARRFRQEHLERLIFWLPVVFFGLAAAAQADPITALSITGFWLAWEWKAWGGADAISAITIFLVWPGLPLLGAFLIAHLLVSVVLILRSWFRERTVRLHRLPGLPILLGAVCLYAINVSFAG